MPAPRLAFASTDHQLLASAHDPRPSSKNNRHGFSPYLGRPTLIWWSLVISCTQCDVYSHLTWALGTLNDTAPLQGKWVSVVPADSQVSRASRAIPSHPKPPSSIREPPKPSRAIPSHPEPSRRSRAIPTVSSHPEPSRAISSHPEPSRAIPSHLEPSRAISSHPQPSRAIPSHLEPSRAISSHLEPSRAIPSHLEPP